MSQGVPTAYANIIRRLETLMKLKYMKREWREGRFRHTQFSPSAVHFAAAHLTRHRHSSGRANAGNWYTILPLQQRTSPEVPASHQPAHLNTTVFISGMTPNARARNASMLLLRPTVGIKGSPDSCSDRADAWLKGYAVFSKHLPAKRKAPPSSGAVGEREGGRASV